MTLQNFSWVIQDELAGLAMVGRWRPLAADLKELGDYGVRLLVTTTRERVDGSAVRAAGIEPLHLPVRDFSPPTRAQLETFVDSAGAVIRRGGAVAVHCFAGKGRTGTFLAAYLTTLGQDAAAAIARVRLLRPGSIETALQEDAVHAFATTPR